MPRKRIAAVSGALLVVVALVVPRGQAAVIDDARHILATKIVVGPLKERASVYTDRGGVVEKLPDELAGWTLIAMASELRFVKLAGLCFTLDRPAVVYVGYHERIRQVPEWLSGKFERTELKVAAYNSGEDRRAEGRWNFEMWKRAFPAGKVVLGPNKNEALPYIVVVEKAAQLSDIHYGGPMPDAVTGPVKEGMPAYPDRPYTLNDVPAELAGTTLLAMKQAYALEDGRYTGPNLRAPQPSLDTAWREVRLARDATVYIAYDASAVVPEWMVKGGFEKTNMSLKVTNIKVYPDRAMTVYSKPFKAGETVWLGPNRGPGGSGWPLQYLVMLKPMGGEK